MRHFASPAFWQAYDRLPHDIRQLADRDYAMLKSNPRHRGLHFKRIGRFWSVRVGLHYRALGIPTGADVTWFWIGSHADYDRMTGR